MEVNKERWLERLLAVGVLLLMGMLFSPSEAVHGAAAVDSGSQYDLGQYCGEDGENLYFNVSQRVWGDTQPTGGMMSANGIWRVKRNLNLAERMPYEVFAPLEGHAKTWRTGLPEGVDAPYTVQKGTISVGSVKLFTVPDWADGTGNMTTQIGVRKYPGNPGEAVYVINYENRTRNFGASVHDFSTYVVVIEKQGVVRVIQAGKDARLMRPQTVLPMGGGSYLLYGDMPGPDFDAAVMVPSRGPYTDINDYIQNKLKLKENQRMELLGIRNGKILFSVRPPYTDAGYSDIRKTALYEIDVSLKIKAAAETLKNVRVIDWDSQLFMGSDGTVYTTASGGEMLMDLTHHRQLDLFQGKKSLGNYRRIGTQKVILARSGKNASLPLYTYKGTPCLCAEDLTGMGYTRQWDAKNRETRMVPAKVWKPGTPAALGSGAVYRSDVVVLFDGKPVTSYNAGGWSLVPVETLKGVEVIRDTPQ